jgi:hypothetical protein
MVIEDGVTQAHDLVLEDVIERRAERRIRAVAGDR